MIYFYKVLPGHKTKMMNLIDYMGDLYPALTENSSLHSLASPAMFNKSKVQNKTPTSVMGASKSLYKNSSQKSMPHS